MAPACGSRGWWPNVTAALKLFWALVAVIRPLLVLAEQYPSLSLRHQQGSSCCPGFWEADWDGEQQYAAIAGDGDSSILHFHDSDCELQGSSSCEPLLSCTTEKLLSQAKILAKGKKIPFPTDDEYTNEELDVFIGQKFSMKY